MFGYKVRKTREAKVGMTNDEINLGKFYVTDEQINAVVARHFNTREEAQAWVRQQKAEAR